MSTPIPRRSKREEALEYAKAVRNDLFIGTKPLNLLLLQCKTICKYLDRLQVNEWIDLELDGYYVKYKSLPEFLNNLPDYRKQKPNFFLLRNNQPVPLPYAMLEAYGNNMALGEPISQIESSDVFTITSGESLDLMNQHLNKVFRESGYTVQVACYAQFGNHHLKVVVAGLRKRILDFVNEIILELEYGAIPEAIFEKIRVEVDQKLTTLSPNSIEKLSNAYEKIGGSGSTEDWSHVASTCRRVLKDIADVVFPARNELQLGKDGKEHKLDDSKYINRIMAGIQADLGKGKDEKFTKSMVQYIGNFLSGIHEYASKGDHALFQKTDAVRCLVYTYMLLGDILNYHIDKDTRNIGEAKASEEEPSITIVNFHPEYTGRKTLKLFPNFRNDGIAARNIKIFYKVMNKFVDLKEIVASKREIQKSSFDVPGTIRYGESINLNDGNPESGISFPDSEGKKSVVLWLTYLNSKNETGEVIFDLRYNGKEPLSRQFIRYTRHDVEGLRKK